MKWNLLLTTILFCLAWDINAQPDPAVLNEPDGSSKETLTPTFDWYPSDGEDPATSYNVQISTSDNFSTILTQSGYISPDDDSWTIGSSILKNSTTYYWRVIPKDGDGVTTPLEDLDYNGFTTEDASFVAPNAPTNVTFDKATITGTSVTISWDEPTQGTGPFNYIIYVYVATWTTAINVITTGSTSLSYPIQGLSPGVVYQCAVQATNINSADESFNKSLISSPSGQFTTTIKDPIPGKSLSIPNLQYYTSKNVGYNYWCWNALCLMTLIDYKVAGLTQPIIAQWALGNSTLNVGNILSYVGNGKPTYQPCDKILMHYQPALTTKYTGQIGGSGGYLTRSTVQPDIDGFKPILCAWTPQPGTQTIGHGVLIEGYDNTTDQQVNYIIYNDPADPDNWIPPEETTWENFVAGPLFQWTGSLEITQSPSQVPNGIKDYVQVSRPVKIPSTSDTAKFSARFVDSDHSGTVAKSWDWRLVLLHDKGDVAVVPPVKGMISQNPLYCTWNARIGTLPQGFNWKRNADGQIMGEVEVGCLDSDPPFFYHHTAIKIAFNDDSKQIITGGGK